MSNPQSENKSAFVVQQSEDDSMQQPLKIHHLSHDLRGPLNSILGFTELLLEGVEGPINDIQTEDLTAIRQSAQTLLQLINNVVDLSKLAEDRLILSFETIDLNSIIENILSKIKADNSIQAELVADIPESLPPLWGDPERVEQMVVSLIFYALKANTQEKNTLNVKYDDTYATIQIITHNVWLPSDLINELFELTVHIDPAGRSELSAGGLNLPLTKQLAQKHQGETGVENQEQIGTIFSLRLPLHQPR